ncbi:Sec1 domain-containing protein 2 [Blyttiomyces sp. JEL0837]|nr:Sec1 domain-containing protein 2 [Blyttiomyces sp. JEL0837]
MISNHLGRHATLVNKILQEHAYEECRLVATGMTEQLHANELDMEPDLAAAYEAYLGIQSGYFTRVSSTVYDWMVESWDKHGQPFDSDVHVAVEHLPIICAMLTNDFFTIPSTDSMFPSLHAHSHTPVVKSLEAPTSYDRQTRQLAFSLCSLLEALDLKEEFFVLGDQSKQVARCAMAQSMNSPRRKSENNVAVILVDRTLDLATPSGHTDNLVDHMYRLLRRPGESSDLAVPADVLLSDAQDGLDFVNLSFAHGADTDCVELLTVLTNLAQKDALVVVRKRLVDLIAKEAPASKPKVLGKVTVQQMEKLLSVFKGDEIVLAKHGALLQSVAAAVEAMKVGSMCSWEDLVSVEKVVALTLAETGDSSSAIAPIRDIIAKAAEAPTPFTPSMHQSPRLSKISNSPTASRSSSVATLDRPPASFDINDALKLCTFCFSLMGTGVVSDDDDYLLISDSFVKALMARVDGVDQDGAMGELQAKQKRQKRLEVEAWSTEVIQRLRTVSEARASLSQLGNLLVPTPTSPYQSLIRRMLSSALSPSSSGGGNSPAMTHNAAAADSEDLVHVPYGGTLGNVLSGFSRLLGAAKLRPSQFSTVIVFVVGGVTVSEVRDARDVGREKGIKVIVGSTSIASGSSIIDTIYPPVPLANVRSSRAG